MKPSFQGSVAERLKDVHPKMLRVEGEGLRKKLVDLKSEIAWCVGRALELAGLSKQEAAFRMGYADQGPVSRWCAGSERPLFDKLYALDGFEEGWIQARAERNCKIQIATVVTISRTA